MDTPRMPSAPPPHLPKDPEGPDMFNAHHLGPRPKSKLGKLLLIFVLIIIIVGGGYLLWDNYFSSSARSARQMQQNYQKYLDQQDAYKTAMKNDTYGGATPQETLDLLISALKKGDLELASKYFVLREDGTQDPKWIKALQDTNDAGKLEDAVSALSKATQTQSWDKNGAAFTVTNTNNEVLYEIDLKLNQYTHIWKIESL